MVEIPTTGNTVPSPPRMTGDKDQDQAALMQWTADLYRSLVLEVNTVGTLLSLLQRMNDTEQAVSFLSSLTRIPPGGAANEVLGKVTSKDGDVAWLNLFETMAAGTRNVNISGTTLITITSKSLTIAAGDTIRFELFGYVRNATGVSQTINLAIGVGSLNLTVAGSATVATGTDTPVLVRGYIGVVSSGQTYVSAEAVMNPVGSAGASVSGVQRNAWQQSTLNFTGTQTVRIAGCGSAAGAGLEIRVAGYMIQKMQA